MDFDTRGRDLAVEGNRMMGSVDVSLQWGNETDEIVNTHVLDFSRALRRAREVGIPGGCSGDL